MPAIKQSFCFNPFNQKDVTPAKLVAAAARIGYHSVEMAAEEHWPLIKDSGLDIAIVVGHASLPDGLNKRGNHDRIEDELLANLGFVREVCEQAGEAFADEYALIPSCVTTRACAEQVLRVASDCGGLLAQSPWFASRKQALESAAGEGGAVPEGPPPAGRS